jgi:septal ring factor EnvC (AmiA/AmiB activator)
VRRTLRHLPLPLLCAALALPAPAAGPEGERRLEEIRSEIERRERQASAFADEAEGYLGELEAMDRELAAIRTSIRTLRHRQRRVNVDLGQARADETAAAQVLGRTRGQLEVRLRALYKAGATGGLAVLYSAADVQQFVRRRQALTLLLEDDARLFARHRAARAAVAQERGRQQSLLAELKGARREVERREGRVRERLVDRRNLVSLLRSRADRERRTAEELRASARRLEEALQRLPRDASSPAGTGLARHRVRWPVEGRIRLGFGRQVDPEFGTETLRNGIEIAAPRGAPVRATAAGRVLFAGWFRGYGQIVILDHGADHVTVSGYLEEIRVEAGDRVAAGDEIGLVGDTGSLSGPGLYLEIRQRGTPVDPQEWLE